MKLTEADVRAMDESALYDALRLITEEIRVRNEGGIVEVVNEWLSGRASHPLRTTIADGGGAVRLNFTSSRDDDGFFYDESSGVLVLRDGSDVEVDFSRTVVADVLTEVSCMRQQEYGLDRSSVLIVDLVTGEVRYGARA